ncbi:YkgJ family cysteine cluster protein [Pseudomonas sp. P8_250]|uniref:YkgJ family cysteine cluster protein n=1 Tax=Pseudomonas sp. P8_250 TaxID=3043446 RepID=UPI002A35F313|nr:YkgJ family cysteine cluster protein [Pseudomonas sp. P8_250]MDX9668714.1 YkgJ family cysteine cluster protein [Pseudomonas sp. P8_250]
MIKIPPELIPVLQAEALEQAEVNITRFNNEVDLAQLGKEFNHAINLKIPKRAKMERFLEVADKLSKAVRPYAACKSGCSYCCSIAATITETEALIMSRASGIKPKKLVGGIDEEKTRDKWFGVPCTFLKNGRCSIYNARPLACRLHANLANTSFFCDTEVPPGESLVPQMNLDQINQAFAMEFFRDAWADIRDFFPPSAK